ncbi:hypothetical protein KR032_007089, partial [Drosophila birchii]
EHNYTIVPTKEMPTRSNLRQLICSIHVKISPKDSNKLTRAELSRLVRHGDLNLRRLRRLLVSRRRFIDFEPMKPLQEAIAQELAEKMGCQTRFYLSWNDSRYLVAYRPGIEPNAIELRTRQMCQKAKDLGVSLVEKKKECELKPMSFRDDKLHWHQPVDHQMAANSTQNSLFLGRKILEKYKTEFQSIQ